MKLEWHLVRGTQEEKPAAIDTTSSLDVVYLRKGIERITVTDNMSNTHTEMWQYNESVLTIEEYEQFSALEEVVNISNANLKKQMEITQKVLDLLLLGGE